MGVLPADQKPLRANLNLEIDAQNNKSSRSNVAAHTRTQIKKWTLHLQYSKGFQAVFTALSRYFTALLASIFTLADSWNAILQHKIADVLCSSTFQVKSMFVSTTLRPSELWLIPKAAKGCKDSADSEF